MRGQAGYRVSHSWVVGPFVVEKEEVYGRSGTRFGALPDPVLQLSHIALTLTPRIFTCLNSFNNCQCIDQISLQRTMESSASQDALCRFCRNSTLICDFLEAKFHEAGPPPEFIDKDIESVSHFRECKTCPVCRLILKSVFMTPGAEEVSRERGMIVIAKEVSASK